MKCNKCSFASYHNSLCKSHFAEQIEGRVKKDIRARELLKKGETFLVKDPVSRMILKTVITMPMNIVRSGKAGNYDKEAVLLTLDDEVVDYLSRLFNKKPLDSKNICKKTISLVRAIKEDELKAYAKLKRVKFKPRVWRGEQKQIKAMLDSLDKKHPETKYSLLKSVEELKALG